MLNATHQNRVATFTANAPMKANGTPKPTGASAPAKSSGPADSFSKSPAVQQALKDQFKNRINLGAAQFANAHGTKDDLAKKVGELAAKHEPKLAHAKPNPFAGLPKFDPKWMQNGASTQSSTLSRLGLS